METEFAKKGVAGAGLGLGIAGTALGVLNGGLGNILGGGRNGANCENHSHGGSDVAIPMMAASMFNTIGNLARSSDVCNEDHVVNRYEASQAARIAELETEVKLRDANTYTDGKILDLYKYVDGKFACVEGQLSQQAVYNATNTAVLNCLQGQVNTLLGLTKTVIPNGSICPGWGNVTVTPAAAPTTGA